MMWCIYTVEYYSATKMNETMPSEAIRMDLEVILLSEVSQTEKDNDHTLPLTRGIKKLIQMR